MRGAISFRLALVAAGLAMAGLFLLPSSEERILAGEKLTVSIRPHVMSRTGAARFGLLQWRGGLKLAANDAHFGGFSGLVTDRAGTRFVALSDHGWWWRAAFAHDDRGFLAGLKVSGAVAPVLSSQGARLHGRWRDGEALAPFDERGLDGPLLAAFERHVRLGLYDWGRRGPKAKARYLFLPPGVKRARENGEIEAVARFWTGPRKGWFIAAGEKNFDERGNIRAWLWRGRDIRRFAIARRGKFRVTDMAVLPDGLGFITLERRFSRKMKGLPGFALRLFRSGGLHAGAVLTGRVLMQASWPLQAIDNMEALALYRAAGGELRLIIMSDDNYNRYLQSTLVLEFALPGAVLSGMLDGRSRGSGEGKKTSVPLSFH